MPPMKQSAYGDTRYNQEFAIPAKPPFPTARKRSFHSSGKNSPKLKADDGLEVTLTWTAHKARSCLGEVGYAMSLSGTVKVALSDSVRVKVTVALLGSILLKADGIQSKAKPLALSAEKSNMRLICMIK